MDNKTLLMILIKSYSYQTIGLTDPKINPEAFDYTKESFIDDLLRIFGDDDFTKSDILFNLPRIRKITEDFAQGLLVMHLVKWYEKTLRRKIASDLKSDYVLEALKEELECIALHGSFEVAVFATYAHLAEQFRTEK